MIKNLLLITGETLTISLKDTLYLIKFKCCNIQKSLNIKSVNDKSLNFTGK